MGFHPEPVIVLQTMEETREFLDREDIWKQLRAARTQSHVKSVWLVELIRELMAAEAVRKAKARTGLPVETLPNGAQVVGPHPSDNPSVTTVTIDLMGNRVGNAEVYAAARERLGLPRLSDEENARETGILGGLVCAAQQYRRHEDLTAAGFVPLTASFLAPLKLGTKLETPSGDRYNVRELRGNRYAMRHGSRSKTASWHTPIREKRQFKEE